jgi:hypothetical protein
MTMAVSNNDSKREWQKPEIAALKVDLRSVAQANGIITESNKATGARAS